MTAAPRPGPSREPGTRFRFRAWLLAFALLAAIRFLTMAPDPWHWDEVLLADAVEHGIDLRAHRPHPPGYPLLVETASLLHTSGVDSYRSLAAVGTVGGLLACAALAAFLSAAGLEPSFAALGGLLYAFIPSIWLFGVRGFSDAPGAAFVFGAGALFLLAIGRRDSRLAAAGIVITAAAAGIRPQGAVALLPIGLWAVAACGRGGARKRAWLLGGLLGAAALSALVWLPAIRGSGGFTPFRDQLLIQAADLQRGSSWSLASLVSAAVWRRWLVDPFGSGALAAAVGAAALTGAALRSHFALRVLLVVLPWAALNVPVSTLFGAPRYAAILLGGVAGLAAGALEALSRVAPRPGAAAAVGLVGACAAVAVAPVTTAAAPSPSVAAIRVAARPPYDRGTLVYDSPLRMHASRLLPWRAQSEILLDRAVAAAARDVVLTADRRVEGLVSERTFGRPDPLLARISLGFLLETRIGVAPVRLSVGTRPAGDETEVVRWDASIPVSIDAPADDAALRGLLDVRGWCQLPGGGAVEPVEFRIDGALARVVRLVRTPRPDVAAAIPEIGDASRAGYDARLDASGLAAGTHTLTVTFRAADGRQRVSGAVPFSWSP